MSNNKKNGLLVGVDFLPTPSEFQTLLNKGQLVPGLEYTTIEVTKKEAVNKKFLTTMFQGAAVKQGLTQDVFSDLQFKEASVNGKRVVIIYSTSASNETCDKKKWWQFWK